MAATGGGGGGATEAAVAALTDKYEAMFAEVRMAFGNVDREMKKVQGEINQLGLDLSMVSNGVEDFQSYVAQEKQGFGDAVAKKMTEHQQVMDAIAHGCQQQFSVIDGNLEGLRGSHAGLFDETKVHVDSLLARMAQLEATGGGSRADDNGRPMDGEKRGFLPEKKTVPL